MVTYEMRDEHREKAVANVETFFGKQPAYLEMRAGDLRDVVGTGERFDRVVLDMPEPWGVLDAVIEVLDPGGVVCGYLPTRAAGADVRAGPPRPGFQQVETFELLQRSWYVTDRSVRPDHRMIGHTGFITVGRYGAGRHARAPPAADSAEGPHPDGDEVP